MTQAFNRDCMEAMKEFPDQFFDLAVVDPPYGDASRATPPHLIPPPKWNRFGQRFDRYKYPSPAEECQETGRQLGLRELEGPGRRGMQKNCRVGRCAGTGLFRGAVPRLTEPDHLGRKLLLAPADKMLSGVAQTLNLRGILYGDGRIRMDKLQRKREGF